MLRLIVIVIASLWFATAAQAQTYFWVEPQVAIEKAEGKIDTGEHFTNVSFGHQWSPRLGVWFQTAHGNLWGETAVGPSFSFSPEFQVGVGIGIEHFEPKALRLRLNAYYDSRRTGSFVYAQYDVGKDSSWIWVDATLLRHWLGLGLILQMPDAGIGPKLEVRTGEHLGFWVAPVYNWQAPEGERWSVLLGNRVMFDW